MLYTRFRPSMLTEQLLQDLEQARRELDPYALLPDEYTGELRRHALIETVHYSTLIEGNTLTLQQVGDLFSGEAVNAPRDQVQEVENYREAIAYIQSLVSDDPDPVISEDSIKAIHYLVTKSLSGTYNPGNYRREQNYVVDRIGRRRIFLPPPSEMIPSSMDEFIRWLNQNRDVVPTLRAALAHLNLVAIHPFLDGNGRTARVLDTLVMYMGGYKSQELVSLEAFFGVDNQGYYTALAQSLGPRYDPVQYDVTPWIEYYLKAHVAQAQTAVRRIHLALAQLDRFEEEFRPMGLTSWHIDIAWLACRRGRMTNRSYRSLSGYSHQTAAKNLAQLTDLGLLVRIGKGRSVMYVPSERVRNIFDEVEEQQANLAL